MTGQAKKKNRDGIFRAESCIASLLAETHSVTLVLRSFALVSDEKELFVTGRKCGSSASESYNRLV